MAKIWCDGSGWNGKRAKWLFCHDDGRVIQQEFTEEKTNNEMEYGAVIGALNDANVGDSIYTDSQLVVNQVKGLWLVKEPRLFSMCATAQAIMQEKRCSLIWIPREENLAGHMLEKG